MGLTGTSLNNFRGRVDEALRDIFPVTLRLPDNRTIPASGTGGKTMSDFMSGGGNKTFRFPFRIPLTDGWQPVIGESIDWIVTPTLTLRMKVDEVAFRPHESIHSVVCKYRRE